MKVIVIVCFVFLYITLCLGDDNRYKTRRSKMLEDELKMSIGGKIVLSEKERLLNKVLMDWKLQELDEDVANPRYFNFSRSFLEYKDDIKESRVYNLIKSMPKGAALHIHSTAILGPDYFVSVTYKDHLHVCFGKKIKFKFAYVAPKDGCDTQWSLMRDVRESSGNITNFDMELRNNFSLSSSKSFDHNTMWKRFSHIFDIIYPLYSYRPVWEEYLNEVLKHLKKDNVMYVEMRSSIPVLYELHGTTYDELFFTNITNRIVQEFVTNHPDFLGAKIIYSFSRHIEPKRLEELLALTNKCRKVFPEFVAGFDLVGHEDRGAPLKEFLPELEAAKKDLDYFFHAGETNRYGTATDENLADAVVLGSKRIGHAYALVKHPLILEEVKKNNIGLEVNVVSNNVLDLVHDLRNHPLALFISQDLPVVLSSDDPGFWGADPLSTDFYVAFMGVASRLHDLRLLKQLALNSLEYSSLSDDRKARAHRLFHYKWKTFVDQFVDNL